MPKTFEELLETTTQQDVVDLPEDSLVLEDGVESYYIPETDSEIALMQEDFPNYSPEERAILTQIQEVIDLSDSEDILFSDKPTKKEDLTRFERRILDLINKE